MRGTEIAALAAGVGIAGLAIVFLGDGARQATPSAAPGAFVRIEASGLALVTGSGEPGKPSIVGSTGTGVCLLDYDLDGDLDAYVVQGTTSAQLLQGTSGRGALYRNCGGPGKGGGWFEDVSRAAGLDWAGWGSGCAVGDYDGDRYPDILITAVGREVLYRNEGDGTFRDVTGTAGIGHPGWSAGAAWFDADGDGDLDLYVTDYVVYDPGGPDRYRGLDCFWRGAPVWCGPLTFPAEPDHYYRNLGDGRFEDATEAAGFAAVKPSYGLGVFPFDADADGDLDLLVGNDAEMNFLFRNDGGRFEDRALYMGLALDRNAKSEASMGVDVGDVDADGDPDVVMTNLDTEGTTLWVTHDPGLFLDRGWEAGIEGPTRPMIGWGVRLVDVDQDGDLDLVQANGHLYAQVGPRYPQLDMILLQVAPGAFRFRPEVLPDTDARVGRGLAVGDLDGDGDLDLLYTNMDAAPTLWENRLATGGFLLVSLEGRAPGTDAIGARVTVEAGGRRLVRWKAPAGSYLSYSDPRVHFGLGDARRVDRLEVRWPSGTIEVYEDLPANRFIAIREGEGVVRNEAGP